MWYSTKLSELRQQDTATFMSRPFTVALETNEVWRKTEQTLLPVSYLVTAKATYTRHSSAILT
jgi:hypothetical protein